MSKKYKIIAAVMASLVAAAAVAKEPQLLAKSDGAFSRPHDLVLDPTATYLYVSDMENDRIAVLDPESLRTIGTFGTRQLSKPHDVAFDKLGRLLVADTGNSRIAIYKVAGAVAELVGEYKQGLSWTEGVAVAADGTVFATNVGNNTLLRVGTDGGKGIAVSSGYAGDFARPHDVATWKDKVYVVDSGNNRIQVFTRDLAPVATIEGDFVEPKYMEVDGRGWLYIADQHNNIVKVFDENARLVTRFGEGELKWPEGVAVSGQYIWISDTYNDRVLRYRWEH